MTLQDRQAKAASDLQQAQQQAQAYGQLASQWAQRVLYLQGQVDLLNLLIREGPTNSTHPIDVSS